MRFQKSLLVAQPVSYFRTKLNLLFQILDTPLRLVLKEGAWYHNKAHMARNGYILLISDEMNILAMSTI